jgi:M6 family metalloprotease-like protein
MRRSTLAAVLAAPLASLGLFAPRASAQDVVLLGERYGTRPPEAYYQARTADPAAFEFSHGRAARMRQLLQAPAGAARVLGPRQGTVEGTYQIPVLLGLFSDSPQGVIPFPVDTVQTEYFGEGPGTITRYYDEVSRAKVTLTGVLHDWIRSSVTQDSATGGKSGLVSGTVGPFIVDLLNKLPAQDWGVFDNDGPDGIPNSGDDDGYVDVLAVLHPTNGAECGGSTNDTRIWSHRWSLRSARRYPANIPYTTTTPSARGGYIRIDDYVVQPIYNCQGAALNEIGVFTHELGHAFGLPDLYDTFDGDGKTSGAGNWDLMATGSWGCNGASAAQPCHMSAWSKAVLGWVDVVTAPDGVDVGTLTLPPVEETGQVVRVNARDGSGDYYLLENRQGIGFDARLYAEGLLIWQISPSILNQLWPSNLVNAYADRMGVWLRQADGLNELGLVNGGRGDADDVFPYAAGGKVNDVFHAASNPASTTRQAMPSGVTILDIARAGDDVTFRLHTRSTLVTVRAQGAEGDDGLFTVNGVSVPTQEYVIQAAPFVTNEVEAVAGEPLGKGERRPFLGWADDDDAPRVREILTPLDDATFTALYGGTQVELSVALHGGVNGVAPGSFVTQPSAPDLWYGEGTTVTLEAVPTRGFAFTAWSGALAGRPNPATFTLDAPTEAGAEFALIYGVPEATVSLPAATDPGLILAPENGTTPYYWTVLGGTLPEGLDFNSVGSLTGAAMATGTYELVVRVRDGIGLTADGSITVEVTEPEIPVERLASSFLLSGEHLTVPQFKFLDIRGNRDGMYDLGDFRAWVLAHPGLPLTAAVQALVGPRRVVVPMRPRGKPTGGDR